MSKTVVFIRSMPLDRDSRSSKMIAEYERRGYRVLRMIWTRGEALAPAPCTIAFTGAGGFGRKLGNALVRLRWNAFIVRQLLKRRAEYQIVHMVDLDVAWTAMPVARRLGKIAIYDAYDHFAAFLFSGGNLASRTIASVERRLIGAADIAVFPDPVRLTQYGIDLDDRVRFIGNIPDAPTAMPDAPATPAPTAPITFVYVGTLERVHRGLELIPRLCADLGPHVRFVIGGVGPLEAMFRTEQGRLPNLEFLGHLPYSEALKLMAEADALYGPYLLSADAHRYAVPNKMYEHLAVGRPLVTNAGTPPAALVETEGSGLVFDGTYEDLRRQAAQLTREVCAAMGARAAEAWRTKYVTLRSQQLDGFFDELETRGEPGLTGAAIV